MPDLGLIVDNTAAPSLPYAVAQLRPWRGAIANAAMLLHGLLDMIDGDPDLEPELDEDDEGQTGHNFTFDGPPLFSALAGFIGAARMIDEDLEPSLAALHQIDQRNWSAGSDSDREAEHDGREPEITFY